MKSLFAKQAKEYLLKLNNEFTDEIFNSIESLALDLLDAWVNNKQVFICGNGGSAANALHLANDFIYGIGACGTGPQLPGLRVESLTSNQGVITCLANDTGYDNIFAYQLEAKAKENDLLIVLSGSGNSPNIINALKKSSALNLKSYAILAFSGGECKDLADKSIHFEIDDMQIAEDTQLIVGHLCMQWLTLNKPIKI